MTDAEDYNRESTVSLMIDAVDVFAHAIDVLIRENCPGVRRGPEVKSCVRGSLLLKYLHNTTFVDIDGELRFDDNGDIRGQYEVNMRSSILMTSLT